MNRVRKRFDGGYERLNFNLGIENSNLDNMMGKHSIRLQNDNYVLLSCERLIELCGMNELK